MCGETLDDANPSLGELAISKLIKLHGLLNIIPRRM
jgi:hypothetical protein